MALKALVNPGPDDAGPLLLLATMGLSLGEVEAIGVAALRAILDTTALDHEGAAGQSAYKAAVRQLTFMAVSKGWEFRDEQGVRIVTSPTGEYSISTSGGDKNTGLAKATPAKLTRGPVSERQCVENGLIQATLDGFQLTDDNQVGSGTLHYHYLYYFDERNQELRSELSLPTTGPSMYERRLILPLISEGYSESSFHFTDAEETPSDDFDVQRKSEDS